MKYYFVIIGAIFLGCCNPNKRITKPVKSTDNIMSNKDNSIVIDSIDFSVSPAVIIYKTKGDYFDKVPVILNDGKNAIIAYPGPKDVFYNGILALPTKLKDGYLLDNRGINKNVVFINFTYEEYSKLKEAPLISDMLKMIIDKNPITEMYNCGSRYQYKEIVNDLNKIIDTKQLNRFKKIL